MHRGDPARGPRRGRWGTNAAPHLSTDAAASPGAPWRAGGKGPLSRTPPAGGEGRRWLPVRRELRGTGPGSWGFESGVSGSRGGGSGVPVTGARCSAGPALISARGSGAGEVSGDGSRPPGRGADGSGPRGYPARPPASSAGNLGRGQRGGRESELTHTAGWAAGAGSFLHPALKAGYLSRGQRHTETWRITHKKTHGRE